MREVKAGIKQLSPKRPTVVLAVEDRSAIYKITKLENKRKFKMNLIWCTESKKPIQMTKALDFLHLKRVKNSSNVLLSQHIITEEI